MGSVCLYVTHSNLVGCVITVPHFLAGRLVVRRLLTSISIYLSIYLSIYPHLSLHLGPNPTGSVQWQRPQVELSRGLAPPARVRNLDELPEQLVQMS